MKLTDSIQSTKLDNDIKKTKKLKILSLFTFDNNLAINKNVKI